MSCWFGESWGAPICDPKRHVATPVGELCEWCSEPFIDGDQGHSMTGYTGAEPVVVYYHHNCFLRYSVFGSVGHQDGICHCYGGEGVGDPPGRTLREAADDAVFRALGRLDVPPKPVVL